VYHAGVRRATLPLLLSLALAASGAASCATSLVKRDVQRQSDGWTVVFHELLDGPNAFTTRSAVKHVPKSGERFLWVILSVQNDRAGARTFPFDACALEMGDDASLPLYVGLNLGTSAEMDETPELAPGERITRKLAFGYPDGRLPQRLVCFGNEIPLGG
jgi:hypothetical protein